MASESAAQLVVVGASAGGIEAVSTLLRTLPADFPVPVVIAQHLDPNRTSHLPDILGRASKIPVRTVEQEAQLEAGVAFVVPANWNVEITDGQVRLRAADGERPRPSIDWLLRSAAESFGEGLIAVILTGTGSDGAAGARYVKEMGGTVVVQNPETARYPDMPQSLAPNTVDIVADLDAIGPLLQELASGAYTPTRIDDRPLQTLLDQLRDRSGIDFSSYKMPTILRRLHRRMVATGMEKLSDYLRYVGQHPEEYRRLVNSFLIKVTEFFRDPDLFRYLEEEVLPGLIQSARRTGNELRIWSAGCATGEEAYSLAILLIDMLGDQLEQVPARIFATDLDLDAINFARRGIYPASALAHLPRTLVERHFTRLDDEYEIKKRVRGLVIFGQHDLGQRAPFPRIDLILCRNVLIYFTPELQRRALQLFAFSLREGGYLVLGKAESTSPLPQHFVLEEPRLKVYRRQGDRVLIPPARIRDSTPLLPVRAAPGHRPPALASPLFPRAARGPTRTPTAGERAEHVLLRLPEGVVVVDRRYDIQSINGAARRILGIHSSAIGEDFIHLAQSVPSTPLRAGIDAAFRGETTVTVFQVATAEAGSPEARYVQVTCAPEKFDAETGPVETVVVLVADVSAVMRERRELEQTQARQQAESERLASLVARLTETNRQLLDANQELTTTNAELRSANEELLVANEEAQAATEEVETLNEELQATNEELETLNEELQATVEELNTTNDDLQARSVELQEMAAAEERQRRTTEAERARLEAILLSISDAVLVVDREGRTVLSNAAYAQMFGDPDADLAATDLEGAPLPPEATPRQRAARGESFRVEFLVTAADGTRCWYEARGEPIRDGGAGAGVVVIRDVTDRSLRHQQEEFLGAVSHELRTPLTSLQGYLDLLGRRLPADLADSQRYVTGARQQVRRLSLLVQDLLDAERLRTGKLTLRLATVDLVPLVAQTVEVAQSLAQGQTIRLDRPRGPLLAQVDAARLEQVLLNLLTNAIAYAPGTDQIDVRLRRAGRQAELTVRDHGPGIPPEQRERIFSRSYQIESGQASSGHGVGLGLHISREIVRAHGGTIEVVSPDDGGAAFVIRLPLPPSASRRAPGAR